MFICTKFACLSKNWSKASWQLLHWCVIFSLNKVLQAAFFIRSLCEVSQWAGSTNNIVFWWKLHTQTDCAPVNSAMTHHFRQREQNFENQILRLGFFSLNTAYSLCKSQRVERFCLLFLLNICHIHYHGKKLEQCQWFCEGFFRLF